MKKLLLATAALVAAVAILIRLGLPAAPASLPAVPDGTVAGILHVHTTRSDGRGTPDDVAAAAARAGLKFVVFTDHGDATRPPDPPTYRSGVLCLDGVEISTTGGHYLALDMRPSPYPLGGDPRDVVDDVRRLGGFGVVAHPDSPRPELQWRGWDTPFDGMEWLNLDTTWRVAAGAPGLRARFRLVEALLAYPFRPAATIASLIRGAGDLYRWQALTRKRRVALLAGADAHANLELRNRDAREERIGVSFPGYEPTFRTLSVHVRPSQPLSGNAATDGALIMRAIRAGHAYTAIDGLATPASFEFTAANALGTVHEGDELGLSGIVTLEVRSNAPASYTTTIYRGLTPMAKVNGGIATAHAPAADDVYWAEIRSDARSQFRRWIVSNPIYVRGAELPAHAAAAARAVLMQPLFDNMSQGPWRFEHDAASLAAFDLPATINGRELRFRYGLGGGPPAGQFAALVVDTPGGVAPNDRVAFTIRSEHAMRVSVQVRVANADRWQRSITTDSFDQERVVSFDDMVPVGNASGGHPRPEQIRAIMFVVDTTNTRPGASGRLWLKKVLLEK